MSFFAPNTSFGRLGHLIFHSTFEPPRLTFTRSSVSSLRPNTCFAALRIKPCLHCVADLVADVEFPRHPYPNNPWRCERIVILLLALYLHQYTTPRHQNLAPYCTDSLYYSAVPVYGICAGTGALVSIIVGLLGKLFLRTIRNNELDTPAVVDTGVVPVGANRCSSLLASRE